MKKDVLTVVTTGYDDSTGFYVNGELVGDVHCDDEHEIPELLYELMEKYNFSSVERKTLNDDARDRVFNSGLDSHPSSLNEYTADDFE